MRQRRAASLLILTLAATGCGAEHHGGTAPGAADALPAPPPAVGSLTDTSPPGMLAQLRNEFETNTGYRDWSSDKLHFESALNAYVKSYGNDALVAAVNAKAADQPIGAIGVLELYQDAGGATLNGWGVLAKATTDAGAAGWFSFEVEAKDGVFGAPAVDAMGDPACATCHTAAPAYLIPVDW